VTLLGHRTSPLWLAALVHRLSGLALAIFLPFHFLALGLAISGEARLEGFLRWTDQPWVKLSEGLLLGLLTIHMLGGIRLLALENFAWREGQARVALLAVGAAMIVAFLFLASVF
jgi:fumarate reductase subunit D